MDLVTNRPHHPISSAQEDEESSLSSLLDELDDIRQSAVLDDMDDDIDMDETVDAPPPRPQEVREGREQLERRDSSHDIRILVGLHSQRGRGPCVCVCWAVSYTNININIPQSQMRIILGEAAPAPTITLVGRQHSSFVPARTGRDEILGLVDRWLKCVPRSCCSTASSKMREGRYLLFSISAPPTPPRPPTGMNLLAVSPLQQRTGTPDRPFTET